MKILLLDPAFSAAPIFDALSQAHDVWFLGSRSSDQLVTTYPDKWICADYSDVDCVSRIVKESCFDVIVPGCTDVSMKTFSALNCSKFYSYTPIIDKILNNKKEFRRLCVHLDLPVPRSYKVKDLPKEGSIICKPVDSFSGQGVTVFDASDVSGKKTALKKAKDISPTGVVTCEDFIDGQLYSFSAFVENKKISKSFIVREGSRADKFVVDTSYVVDNYSLSKINILNFAIEKLSKYLDLCDGLVHTQFIDSEDKLYLIEITRRCPGDLYSLLIEHSTGFRFAAQYASYFTGDVIKQNYCDICFYVRHTVKQEGPSIFRDVRMSFACNNVSVVPVMKLGEKISSKGPVRVAIVFAKTGSKPEMNALYDHIMMS